MPSAIVNATIQAVVLSATSNLLAQVLENWRSNVRSISTPPLSFSSQLPALPSPVNILEFYTDSGIFTDTIHTRLHPALQLHPLHPPQHPAQLPLAAISRRNLPRLRPLISFHNQHHQHFREVQTRLLLPHHLTPPEQNKHPRQIRSRPNSRGHLQHHRLHRRHGRTERTRVRQYSEGREDRDVAAHAGGV